MNTIRVLGIDPGYERLGVAIVEKKNGKEILLFSGCMKTSPKLGLVERIFNLGQEIKSIIKKYKPTVLAIEKLFFTNNQKTVMGVSEVKGVVTYIAKLNGLEVHEITPLQVKDSMVGYGKADKNQISFMVKKILGLDQTKRYDDEFDAMAVALTGLLLTRKTSFAKKSRLV